MRKRLLLAAAALLVPAAALAQIRFGARVGYGIASGGVGEGAQMRDWVKSQIPFEIEALYRLTPELSLGPYVSYGFGFAGGRSADGCNATDESCSASVIRVGVEGVYTLRSRGKIVPWIGAGAGFELTRLEESTPIGGFKTSFSGLELLGLQGGAEWLVSERFAAGPFLAISFGRFDDSSVTNPIESITAPMRRKSFHEWIQIGVRARFDP